MTDSLLHDDAPSGPGDPPAGVLALDDEPSSVTPGSAPVADRGDGGGPPGPGRWTRITQRLAAVPAEGWITAVIVLASSVFVVAQLSPIRLISDTVPAGGDMGAHVWGPAYLRDHLLPEGRLTGWTPDWYAGFPAFGFYMVLPALAIALLSFVIPYGIAFKLVAVSGLVSLPVAAYLFGRLSRLPFPAPALLSVGATVFLFDRSFSIYGGNIASTLAGEFAFSISLSFALVYLGVLGRGLETGKYRGWAAVLLALTGLCHLIPFIFAMVGTGVWFLLRPGTGRVKYLVTMLPVGGALTAFWMLPFYLKHGYMNDMGWEKIESTRWVDYLWSREKLDSGLTNYPDLKWAIALAAVGLLLSLVYRRRAGVFLAAMAGLFALGFMYMPEGRLWNARLLPFYYLMLYLLAAVGVAELGRLLSALFAPDVNRPLRWIAIGTPIAAVLAVALMLAMPLRVMPGGSVQTDGSYRWLWFSTKDSSFVSSWADWNFTGYDGYDTATGTPTYKKSYPEYRDVMLTMADVGRTQGCGRAMWEHEEQHDRYGTPMAMMLLPYWTDGCIGSMEGLYFESSTTTPYHFLNQDELSANPSNAQRDLPYGAGPPTKAEFDLGVEHLQLLGVRYYMAISDTAKKLATQNSSLTQVATTGPWNIYEVADSALVTPLAAEPAVLTGQPLIGRDWQDTAVCWYQQPEDWDLPLVTDGPASWQRVERTVVHDAEATPSEKCQPRENWGWLTDDPPEVRAQKPITVSNIATGDDTISFDVSEPGVPVYVKASYFPNWKASGAEGPYRATPNLMVVVPTENHVELHYGYTGIDFLSYFLTLLGVAGLVWLFRADPVLMSPPRRFWGKSERPDLYPTRGPDLRFENEGAPPPDWGPPSGPPSPPFAAGDSPASSWAVPVTAPDLDAPAPTVDPSVPDLDAPAPTVDPSGPDLDAPAPAGEGPVTAEAPAVADDREGSPPAGER